MCNICLCLRNKQLHICIIIVYLLVDYIYTIIIDIKCNIMSHYIPILNLSAIFIYFYLGYKQLRFFIIILYLLVL